MKKLRLAPLSLSLVMAASLFTGCGKTEDKKTASTAQASTATQAPKRTQPVTLDVALVSWGTKIPAEDADFIRKEIRDAIKVDVKLMTVDSFEDYKNQLNMKIASGSAPDYFQMPDRNALIQYATTGALMEATSIESKLDKYMAFIKDEHKRTYYNGKSYGIAKKANINYLGLWVRKDWIDAAGVKAPTTPQEFLDVAKVFTEKDPDGNGRKDTFGVTGIKHQAFSSVFGAFGVPFDTAQIYVKDGKATAAFLEPGYKEALEFCKKFIEAGVVDPDFMLNTGSSQRDAKLYSGKYGMTATDWTTFTKDENAPKVKAGDPKAEWVQIPALRGSGGQYVSHIDVGNGTVFGISKSVEKNTEKLNAVIDLINYISSDGNKLVMYGLKDKHWKEEGGKIMMTETGAKESGYSWLYQFTGRPETEYLMTKFAKQASYIEAAGKNPVITTLTGYVDKPQNYMHSDAQKYMDEELSKFLYGKRPMSEYDSFAKTVMETYNFKAYLDQAQKQFKELGYIK